METEKKYLGGWWLWILLLIVVTIVVLFSLRSTGLVGYTWIERQVFEQSYQKQAGESAKLATFKATKASLETQLRRTDLSAAQRADFEAQLAAIDVQIGAIEQ